MPRPRKGCSPRQSSSSPDFEQKPAVSKFLQIKRQLYDDGSSKDAESRPASRVGPSFQAEIPELSSSQASEEPQRRNETLWIPITSERKIQKLYETLGKEKKFAPCDDEEVLFALVSCGYRIPESVSVVEHMDYANAPNRTITLPRKKFTKDEMNSFEDAMLTIGKDFVKIRDKLLPHRTVGDLVEFYYFWKKSRRHDQLVYRTMECFDLMQGEIMKLTDLRKLMK